MQSLRPMPALLLMLPLAAAPPATLDTPRLPFLPGKAYAIQVTPGNPFILELPVGERARNVYHDAKYWQVESTPESGRVAIRAVRAADIIGAVGSIQIETEPSDLLITLRAEVLEERASVPLALQLYQDARSTDPVRAQVDQRLGKELVYAKHSAQEKARQDFAAWRKQLLAKVRQDYRWGGDFRIDKVVDDGVQTFITCATASDHAVLELVDKSGKSEKVNYELENGCYVVQDKILRPGEKFRLLLGKEQAWIALK